MYPNQKLCALTWNMGAVDLVNGMRTIYRSYHKTKWLVRIFEHFMDCAAVNFWLQYRDDCLDFEVRKNNILDLITFKMGAAECLIGGVGPEEYDGHDNKDPPSPGSSKTPSRSGTILLSFREVARQNAAHLP